LHRASIFVLSSFYEALPNVILEAMAASLPVVATRTGGVPEVVAPGQTGWLVPPQDPPALAAALSHLLSDATTRKAFSQAGQERARQHFSLEVMVRRHEEVLEEIIQAKR
jgi:starch synthase